MKGAILQPGYLPWLGFFNQMAISDCFVFLDDVQYDRRGWRNRNRVKGANGPIWLTIPVHQKGRYHQLLCETEIDNRIDWASKHIKTIEFNYKTTPFFSTYFDDLAQIFSQEWTRLIDLDYALIELHLQWLGIHITTYRSSDIQISNLDKTGRLVEICEYAGITEYISGPLCQNYMECKQFHQKSINVLLHEYPHPGYSQLFPPFIPYLSTLDLLFNEGPNSLEVLKNPNCLIEYRGDLSVTETS